MHEYSTDVEQSKIIFGISIISILVSSGLTTIINTVIAEIPCVEFMVSITAMSIFGVLYKLFDIYIWKCMFLRGLVQIPNISGKWKGEIQSSYHDFKDTLPVELTIKQTWTKICIDGKFNHSKSISNTASLKINSGVGVRLYYSYNNEKYPKYHEMGTSNHRGYADLEINEDVMEGSYFNNPANNKNFGYMKLKKQS